MNYIIKLETAAGEICLGPYSTLEEAREAAKTRGQIIAVIKPTELNAVDIQAMTQAELLKLLECDTL
jgi:hypothetical protein